jgi:hypothetical protein
MARRGRLHAKPCPEIDHTRPIGLYDKTLGSFLDESSDLAVMHPDMH